MDVFEAVDSRIACRAFLDKPVDPKIVRDLIVRAQRAASGGNLQSWNVYALMDEPLAEFKRIVGRAHRARRPSPLPSRSTRSTPSRCSVPYKERREAHGVQLYGSLGIAATTPLDGSRKYKKNFEFFNAPVGAVHHHRPPARPRTMGRPRRLHPRARLPCARIRPRHLPAGGLGAAPRHGRRRS